MLKCTPLNRGTDHYAGHDQIAGETEYDTRFPYPSVFGFTYGFVDSIFPGD